VALIRAAVVVSLEETEVGATHVDEIFRRPVNARSDREQRHDQADAEADADRRQGRRAGRRKRFFQTRPANVTVSGSHVEPWRSFVYVTGWTCEARYPPSRACTPKPKGSAANSI
jgi:hypothetical protein